MDVGLTRLMFWYVGEGKEPERIKGRGGQAGGELIDNKESARVKESMGVKE